MPSKCASADFFFSGWLSLYGKGDVALDELHSHHIACRKLRRSLPHTLPTMTMHPVPS